MRVYTVSISVKRPVRLHPDQEPPVGFTKDFYTRTFPADGMEEASKKAVAFCYAQGTSQISPDNCGYPTIESLNMIGEDLSVDLEKEY